MKKINLTLLVIVLVAQYLYGQSHETIKTEHNLSAKKQGQFVSQELFVGGSERIFEYRIPSLITSKKGTLIAVCDARVDKPGDAPNNIDLVMKRSFDGGKTWSKQEVIVDFPGNDAAADPSMVLDRQTGTIWLAYDHAVADPQGHIGRIIRIHLIKSDNDGDTWSPPINLNYLIKGKDFWLQNSPGVGLFTPEGVIVFPMYSVMVPKGNQLSASTPDLKGTQQVLLVYSEDHGKTWHLSNGIGDINNETQIVNLPEGRIMANMRKPRGHGYRQISITSDIGKTWSEVYDDTTLIEPGCQASLINYNFNNKSLLIFSNPADQKERKNMVIRASSDEGKTWPQQWTINTGSAGYSCLTQLPNGNIGLLYEADINYKKRYYERILFVEIPYQELF